jgi:hypothetical protein
LNGSDYIAIPFRESDANSNRVMEIGWISKRNFILSDVGQIDIEEMKRYLGAK